MQEDFFVSFVVLFFIYRRKPSLRILDIISVIMSTKKYDTDTSLSFHIVQAFGTAKVNLTTK